MAVIDSYLQRATSLVFTAAVFSLTLNSWANLVNRSRCFLAREVLDILDLLRSTNFARSSIRASRGCSTMLFSHCKFVVFPRAVGEYTVRFEPCTPASVLVGLISPAASRLLIDRYTKGRRTFSTATKDSSESSSFEIAKPCRGFSQMSANTIWSRTEGVYSLTVTILARLSGCLLVAASVNLGACAQVDARGVEAKKTTITVSAAASLAVAYKELGKQFEQMNPAVKIRFNFASSSSLVNQIQSGAPSDVLAAADLTSFYRLRAKRAVVGLPKVFARNAMQLIVKPGNPLGITSITDLNKAGTVSLCAKNVPCGIYARQLLSRSGVMIAESKITRGVDATAALNAVANGDADAGIVYATDVLSARKTVRVIAIPGATNIKAAYGISVIRASKQGVVAEKFVAFVLSSQGRRILSSYGFQAP
jgi:molybdate transport system substrate-binding protein